MADSPPKQIKGWLPLAYGGFYLASIWLLSGRRGKSEGRVKGLSTCRCQDFDRTSTGLEERNVESATAEVEDTHELLLIAARTVRESHRHGLLEQTHFCETWLWNRAKRERARIGWVLHTTNRLWQLRNMSPTERLTRRKMPPK